MVFHWSLIDSKPPKVSRTLLSILVNLKNAVAWMIILPLISKYPSPYTNPFVTVSSISITISITVTFMFHSFFSSQTRSRYLSLFYYYFYHYESFTLFFKGGFNCKPPQVSRTLQSILTNFCSTVDWVDSILLLSFSSSSLLSKTVLTVPTITGRYLSRFLSSLTFTFTFFLLIKTRSGFLPDSKARESFIFYNFIYS